MKSTIFSGLIILVLGYIFAVIGPWWLPFLACFLICAWQVKTGALGFLLGAICMLFLWLGYAFILSNRDVAGLTQQLSDLFTASIPSLKQTSGTLLIFGLTSLIALVTGGMSGWSGVLFRKLFTSK